MRRIGIVVAGASLTLVLSVAAVLAIDFCFGAYLLPETADAIERRYRVAHPQLHHALAPSYRGAAAWGPLRYEICTNEHGFKTSCERDAGNGKTYDVAFLGDSFTEGIGLPYEQTFVGRIASALPSLRIANLGVGSYSPTIYLAKVRALLAAGFELGEVVVYVDIGDIQDETLYYAEGGQVKMHETAAPQPSGARLRSGIADSLPLTRSAYRTLRSLAADPAQAPYLRADFARGAWTYDGASDGYGAAGVDGALAKAVAAMAELHAELDEAGVALSIGVYPWPSQLLYDEEQSRQVRVWRDFCERRCAHFFDAFPVFFAYARREGKPATLERLFIPGDYHYSAAGNELVAASFLAVYGAAGDFSSAAREN